MNDNGNEKKFQLKDIWIIVSIIMVVFMSGGAVAYWATQTSQLQEQVKTNQKCIEDIKDSLGNIQSDTAVTREKIGAIEKQLDKISQKVQ